MEREQSPPAQSGATARRWIAVHATLAVAAAAYILYLSLLVTCDIFRVVPRGFDPDFRGDRVLVSKLQPTSLAARAGLQNGDRILRANGQELSGYLDWQRVAVHVEPSRPFVLEIERQNQVHTTILHLSTETSPLQAWRTRPALLTFRLAQAITLALAILVAVRRWFQPAALLGALLLASMAVVSLVLPMRLGAFWRSLPGILEAPLWVPYATAAASGPLLFAFATVFPRRIFAQRWIAIALAPAALAVGWHLYAGMHIMRPVGPAIGLSNQAAAVLFVNVAYAGLAVALLVWHRRAVSTLTDRRRIGVLIFGIATGAAAGAGLITGWLRNPGGDVFGTWHMTALSLLVLAMPASFAYAILRHRLFDVRLIVRQGLRYALARRMVDGLIPLLGALLVLDVARYRDHPIAALVERRWWLYLLLGTSLLIVRAKREHWLRQVDRRFFRERYDAQRLLTSIAEQVSRASSFDTVAPVIVQQIDEALHPTFATVLTHMPAASSYAERSRTHESERVALPSSLTVIGVLSVLQKPLALSLGDTAWVRHQLPLEERTMLVEHGIELLVPVFGEARREMPLGLLVLGPRRSEEPYNQEDLHLLTTIADAVGVLLERSSADQYLAECERCGRCYGGETAMCPGDGHPLIRTRGSLIINGRYRLEARLGRGGMGTVYSATDTVLVRPVAVKVIRDELAGPLDLAARFRAEARAAASFAHPHVVRIYDFGFERSGRPFLVMELLEGATLRERLTAGPLPAPEVLHILDGVCAALAAAHDRGFVHRDLKPENIFLQRHSTGPVPKVLDFGLAKALHAGRSADGSTAPVTSAGLLVGTVEYMAPEQVAGDEVSPCWDLWAVAVIAYEMLSGRHPFRRTVVVGGSDAADDLATAPYQGSRVLAPAVEAFFRCALSAERAERPQSAATFLAGIEKVLA